VEAGVMAAMLLAPLPNSNLWYVDLGLGELLGRRA